MWGSPGCPSHPASDGLVFTQCHQTSCLHNVTKHLVYTMSPNTLFTQCHQTSCLHNVTKHLVYTMSPNTLFTQCHQTSCLHNVTKHLVYTMSPNISFQGRRKAINFEVGWLKRVYVWLPGSQIYPRKQSADISASSRKRAQRLCAWKVNFTMERKCW